ncbi:hypothetical protein ONZ45_g999 [Pleurotus djamor]|nr:hypothetical protein ONZ45_g999 [Pleurotus djamor]
MSADFRVAISLKASLKPAAELDRLQSEVRDVMKLIHREVRHSSLIPMNQIIVGSQWSHSRNTDDVRGGYEEFNAFNRALDLA